LSSLNQQQSSRVYRIRGPADLIGSKRLNLQLLQYQRQLFDSTRPVLAFVGGTGSGKTYFAPRWLFWQMVNCPGQEWIVSAPTIPMLKRNPVKYLLRFFREIGLQHEYNKTEQIFTLKHGLGVIYGISAENPDRMQGIHAKGIVGDEAGMFPRLWWDTAIQRVGFHGGRILLTTTPYAENWLKTEVYDPWLAGDERIEWVNPRSIDNPYYPRGEYEDARRRLPEWKFKLLYEGQFTRPAGLIYPAYSLCDPIMPPADWLRIRGLDFGYHNPTAVIELARSPEGVWYAYRELKASEMSLPDLAKELAAAPQVITYADPSGKQLIETLRREGIRVVAAGNEVLPGISLVHDLLKTGRLKICRNLKHTIDELNTYSWEIDRNDNLLDRPRKENDHLMDAIRYALFTVEGQKKAQYGGAARVLRSRP